MYKIAAILTFILFIAGCGRTESQDATTSLNTKSTGDLHFVTVKKSVFVPTDNSQFINSGHYRMVIKTENKPAAYITNDALENADYYTLIENNKIKDEAKIRIEKSNNEVKSKILLLLDLSGSIIEGGCNTADTVCSQLVTSTNRFISNMLNNGNFEIAIYYFNSKKEILPLSSETEYPTGNKTILIKAVNQLKNPDFLDTYLKGFDSTNLYGAVKQSGAKICSWINCDNQNSLEIGSVVVFTDGRDLADIVTKKDMLKSIQKDIQYYTIGIGNADNNTLKEISGSAHHFEATSDNIESAFTNTFNDILHNSSFYKIKYCPATQEGRVTIKVLFEDPALKIKVQTNEDKITLDNTIDLRCDL